MPLQKLLFASLAGVLLAGTAHALPVIVDPNFSDADASRSFNSNGVKYNTPGWTSNLNTHSNTMSFNGQSQFNVNAYWNNGALPSGRTVAGFLANVGDSMYQTVTGFNVGDIYQISLLANARSGQTGTPQLDISASGSPVASFALSAADPTGTAVTPFQTELYSFVAQSSTETITLGEDFPGSTGGSLLLSGLQLSDLGSPVPEPVSLALLATGLAGLTLVRRRR